jgi:hypothetical protein
MTGTVTQACTSTTATKAQAEGQDQGTRWRIKDKSQDGESGGSCARTFERLLLTNDVSMRPMAGGSLKQLVE